MATYQIIDLPGDEFDILDRQGDPLFEGDAEGVLDFIIAHHDETFAFGEFEVDQSGAISRMKFVYGVSR